MYDYREDGVTHINIYSKAITPLGRRLSNFHRSPFTHPVYGRFESVEGFIYFLGSGEEKLRTMFGYKTKDYGRIVVDQSKWLPEAEFKKLVKEALRLKIKAHKEIADYMIESTLPFTHYYVYGTNMKYIPKWDWVVKELELIRKELKNGALR